MLMGGRVQSAKETRVDGTDDRNVIDYYKYWDEEAILADLDTRRSNFSVFCVNVSNDFNIGTVIRNANAFLARQVFIYGRKKWDRRGAVGTHNYSHMEYVREVEELKFNPEWFVVGIDNVKNAKDIREFKWPIQRHVLMVFGQEQLGIPENVISACHEVIYIPQLGSVRSLNVGTASGIAMYDYIAKVR